jgi:DNA-binding SARP family transcriptional activator
MLIRLRLLQGFSLSRGGAPVDVSMGEQRLLAFLAVNDRPLARSYVASTLWRDSSEKHAQGNLRSAIWRLQKGGANLVEASRTRVRIGEAISVDVHDVSSLAARMIGPGSTQVDPAGVDEAALCGELLPGWYDEWVVVERERMRQLQLHALEALCSRLLGSGDYPRAVQVGLAATAAEPLRESAHRLLIQVHLAEGNVAEAVRQYELYRGLLATELGIEPSLAIKRLLWRDGLETSA